MPPSRSRTGLGAILILTFVASLGTGVQWSGISFVAKHDYGYGQELTFLLFIVTGLTYIVAALGAGALTRALTGRVTPRQLLACTFILQAGVCLLPRFFTGSWVLWTVACAVSILTATYWPIIESYLSTGRYGDEMRRAMGWWNLSWTTAVGVALLLMAPLLQAERASLAIVALAPVFLLCTVMLYWFGSKPGLHEEKLWKESITGEYRYLLKSARVLLPLSYILMGTLSALMPYRLEDLATPTVFETPATATWMFARVAVMALMWKLAFWRGKWEALLLSGAVFSLGFTLVVVAPSISLLLLGLVAFGAAQGIAYFAALYYAMSVGAASVESGGTHEGLIGVGYTAGPLAALAGIHLPSLVGLKALAGPTGIVVAVGGVAAAAVLPALYPYISARRLRKAAHDLPEASQPTAPIQPR